MDMSYRRAWLLVDTMNRCWQEPLVATTPGSAHGSGARVTPFDGARVQDVLPPAPTGLLATNLPYGDRIGGGEAEVRQLYEEFGDTLKQRFAGWRAAVLAANASPYKAIGLKPSRTINLMNGSIPCRLLLFDLYAGSRRPAPSSTAPAAPSNS